jgi:2-furoyl-CoA dehydrogenase large subunit
LSRSSINGRGHAYIASDPATVWSALLDEQSLKFAIPGCEQLVRTGNNAFKATVMLGVGPIKGRFDANIELTELDEPRFAVLGGKLSGPLGAASGSGRLSLAGDKSGCRIEYSYDVRLSGRAAMVGGRMVNSATRRLVAEFFRRFALSIDGGASSAPPSWRKNIMKLFGAQR